MKLPKQIPVKLLYVLLVIYIWSSVMNTSTDPKEDFDMKELKNMLMGGTDDKEDFDMKQMKDVKNMLMGKLMGKNDDKEDFEAFNKEDEKQSVTPWATLYGSPIKQ